MMPSASVLGSSVLTAGLVLASIGPALGTLPGLGSPDAQSGAGALATSSLDGSASSAPSNSLSSTTTVRPITAALSNASPTSGTTPSSLSETTTSAVGSADSNATTPSTVGVAGMSVVPFDVKSSANPHWVAFLKDVASQTRMKLADLEATAASDPSIGIMWDVYVQSAGDGTALPSDVGGSPSTGASAGAGDSGGIFGTSAVDTSGGPVMSLYEAGGQKEGTASSPTMSSTWFQSFFKDPSQTAPSSQNSYTQPSSSYDSGLNTNSFGSTNSMSQSYSTPYGNSGGSTGGSQLGSSPTSSGSSMEQMFSQFRLPSSSSSSAQQQYYPQQYQQQNAATGGMNMAQQFMSMMSPMFGMPSISSMFPQSSGQQFSTMSSSSQPSSGAVPYKYSTMFNSQQPSSQSTPQQQQQQQTAAVGPTPSNDTITQLSLELLRLLGKDPTAAQPSASSSSISSSQPPQTPASQTPAAPGAPVLSGQTQNTPMNQVQPGNQQGLDFLSSLTGLGSMSSSMMPGFPPTISHFSPMMKALNPVMRFYNARFDARASRDLGCRTLGELLDVDVPRTVELSCNRLCPALMPGAVTGKRFGLTCLCCPVYVSDQAIGVRSMYRRAEALT